MFGILISAQFCIEIIEAPFYMSWPTNTSAGETRGIVMQAYEHYQQIDLYIYKWQWIRQFKCLNHTHFTSPSNKLDPFFAVRDSPLLSDMKAKP